MAFEERVRGLPVLLVDNTGDVRGLPVLIVDEEGNPLSLSLSPDTLPIGDPFQSVIATMEAGDDFAIIVQGDSTGDEVTEWPYRIGQLIGGLRSSIRVQYKLWSHAAQAFGAWIVIQAGALGERYVQFDGTRTRLIPNAAVGGITGDMDIRLKVAPDDWTPSAAQVMVAQQKTGGQLAFRLYIATSGVLTLNFSADGTTQVFKNSTVAVGGTDGQPLWLRYVLDVDNGAVGYDVKFYTSPADDGVTWTQLGTTVTTAIATSIKNSTDDYEIGGRLNTFETFIGKIYEVQIRQGIDGKIINPQPISAWQITNDPAGNTDGGSTTLYIVNASVASQNLSYHLDSTRFSLEVEPYEPALHILSDSINEASTTSTTNAGTGKGWMTALDSWLTAAKARLPVAAFAVITQNPVFSPAGISRLAHAKRISQLRMWAVRNAVPFIDTYRAFTRSSDLNAGLIGSDGVHPGTASVNGTTGRELEAQAVLGPITGLLY